MTATVHLRPLEMDISVPEQIEGAVARAVERLSRADRARHHAAWVQGR